MKGLSAVRVGQQLIASTYMPTAALITAVDAGAGTITVDTFPSVTGTNALARIQPSIGQVFIRSGSFTDPQYGYADDAVRVADITGSEDTEYVEGQTPLYSILAPAATVAGTAVPGRLPQVCNYRRIIQR